MSDNSLTVEQVKSFHHKFLTGVTAVTTLDGDKPHGLIVNAFSSLSLDPPTIIVCIQRTSSSYALLFARDYLGVNILAADQKDVCTTLANKWQDKFATIPWSPGPHGSPLITGAAAWLEGRITERIQASTHSMFIAQMVAVESFDYPPLLYASGQFYHGGNLEPV